MEIVLYFVLCGVVNAIAVAELDGRFRRAPEEGSCWQESFTTLASPGSKQFIPVGPLGN